MTLSSLCFCVSANSSIAAVLRFERAGGRQIEIAGLGGAECRQLNAELVEVEAVTFWSRCLGSK